MLNKPFWKKVFEKQGKFDDSRHVIIALTADAQHGAKQAIFALQRENFKEAQEKLAAARTILAKLDKQHGKDFRLRMQGSWKSACEEFAEAKLFSDFMNGKEMNAIKEFNLEPDEYFGGLSDVTGEIVRMMVIWTTQKQFAKVHQANEVVHEVIHQLMEYNFTGYLRTKFDQAKNNLRKAEEIVYDISLKN